MIVIYPDSFAGSGTTAHAVLNLNKTLGSKRTFILIELDDYADSITAERVKRVIDGYSQDQEVVLFDEEITASNLERGAELLAEAKAVAKDAKGKYSSVKKPVMEDNHLKVVAVNKAKDAVPGTGGDFTFYDLGEMLLLPNGNLNENVSADKIREYVYYMETKEALSEGSNGNPYYMGASRGAAYYFYYEKEAITIPAMKKEGYPAPFATAVASISSILGPIIPPSITLIVYASITNISVQSLFMGSVVPGVLLVLGLAGYGLWYGKKHDLPAHERVSAGAAVRTIKDSIWALLMPVIILGGIFGGIFTPTEAAAVSVVYALIIGLFVHKDITFKELPGAFVDASVSTATIMVMVGLSKASSYVVVTSGLPQLLMDLFTAITDNKFVILLLLNLLFLVIGMLMEANAAIIMMTPILTPLLTAFNISPLAFGIVMSFNLCIGLVTPPVGLCLLLCNQIGETSLGKALKAMLPMLLISIIVLMLITYIEPLTTFLPSLLN